MDPIELAYNEYCKKRFPIPTDGDLVSLEERIHVRFPDVFRKYILSYNGGYFCEPRFVTDDTDAYDDGLTFMHGIGADIPFCELGNPSDIAIWEDNNPPVMVPVGYTLRGNFVVMFVVPGEDDYGSIALVTPEKTYYLADDITEFFSCLQPPPPGSTGGWATE